MLHRAITLNPYPIPKIVPTPLTPEQEVEKAHKQKTVLESLPTYEQVIKSMEEYIDGGGSLSTAVSTWMSEYSESNHGRMAIVVSLLACIEESFYDENFDVPKADEEKIYDIGCIIDRDSGYTGQQACYYIAINFLAKDYSQVRGVEFCWHGAGSWLL